MRLSRRAFIEYGLAGAAALAAPWTLSLPVAAASPASLRRYVWPLPVPGDGIVVAHALPDGSGSDRYAFEQVAIARQLHPDLGATPIWAYDDGSGLGGQAGSFGMVVAASAGRPVEMDFTNRLPAHYPGWIPVDTRLTPLGDHVRVMTHLHGGFVPAASDGNPYMTPDGFGPDETQHVRYPNQAPENGASLLWFHDHGLGATRLNVFAGLAAGYLIRDQYDTGGPDNANGLPHGAYEVPLVIQDRQFDADGRFLYPLGDVPDVVWAGEYFGDVMLVNGRVWPYLEVEPRLYRFRVLNGCNARILALQIPAPAGAWQIGAEGGLWAQPVPVRELVLAPAERADVLVDFSRVAGHTLHLTNATPGHPVSTPAPRLTDVLELRVGAGRAASAAIPAFLAGGRQASLPEPAVTRFITLNEVDAETAGWMLTLNGSHFDDGPATETPAAGTVEEWWYVNLTPDTHPMHTHLVNFQVVGRLPFNVKAYVAAVGSGPLGVPGGHDPRPFATGKLQPPDPTELGFKDTVKANPGFATVVRARFDLPSGTQGKQTYVHHCHIVEHEDNDMMRPYEVTP